MFIKNLYQGDELCVVLEEWQPWTPKAIHALIEDRYNITYHPVHLIRKLRDAGMNCAKTRTIDPRRHDDAEEILAERLIEALGEDPQEPDKK